MIEIKKGSMTVTRMTNDLKVLTDTSDGIYIKFGDDTELIIPMTLTQQQKVAITTASRINFKNVRLNFNTTGNDMLVIDM